MLHPASAVDEALLLLFCGFLLYWDGYGESLWLNLPIAGGTPSTIKVHEGKGMMDLHKGASTFKRPISDLRYIGRADSTFNHHRTDPRLFAPFATMESRGTLVVPFLLPHFFYWLKQLRHGLFRNPTTAFPRGISGLSVSIHPSYTQRRQCAPLPNTPPT